MVEDTPFVDKRILSGEELPIVKKPRTDTKYVLPGNIISKQLLEPYGKSELDTIRLKDQWAKLLAGHEHCDYFSEYACNDLNYQGVVLAKSMNKLAAAISEVMDEKDAGQLLDREMFDAMVTEGKELFPHVLVLSGDQNAEGDD